MKHILLGLFVIGFSMASNAQSVKIFSKKTHQMINDSTYIIYGDGSRFEIKEEFKAVMDSQDSMLVGIKRVELDTMVGSEDYFCWYLCYTPVAAGTLPVWYAADSLMMHQGDTVSNFSVYLKPNGKKGNAKFRYVFYPENNPSDTSFVDIVFDIVTIGLEEISDIEVSIYPNPASEMLNVTLPESLDGNGLTMDLFDVRGQLVQREKLTNGLNSVDLNSNLLSGSYIVRVHESEKIYLNRTIEIRR